MQVIVKRMNSPSISHVNVPIRRIQTSQNDKSRANVALTFKVNESYSNRSEIYTKLKIKRKLENVQFTGRGLLKDEWCGTFHNSYVCDCKKTHKVFKHNCGKLSCPQCFPSQAYRIGSRVADRMISAKQFVEQKGLRNVRVKHIAISFDYLFNIVRIKRRRKNRGGVWYVYEKLYDLNRRKDYINLKRYIITCLRKAGLVGAIQVYHPYRIKHNGQKRLKLAPHFHLIAVGYLKDSRRFHENFGFTYTIIRTCRNQMQRIDGVSHFISERDDIRNLMGYLLTHAGFYSQHHAYSWIGHFAPNKLKSLGKPIKSERTVACDYCGSGIYRITNERIVSGRYNRVAKLIHRKLAYGNIWRNNKFDMLNLPDYSRLNVVTKKSKIFYLGSHIRVDRSDPLKVIESQYTFLYKS